MTRSSFVQFGVRILPFLFGAGLSGCGAEAGQSEEIATNQSALVITNCTGSAISAAVAAGGDIVLSCGPTPVTVSVPTTTITLPTRLRTLVSGSVTLANPSNLFLVRNNASFQVENLGFSGQNTGFLGIHITSGSATVIGSTFSGYRGGALSVHAARLTVLRSTFAFNGAPNSFFAVPIYNEGSTTDVRDSFFAANQSLSGGAITSFAGALTVSGCTFLNNLADRGGAIYVGTGAPNISNSTFSGNRANTSGGAISATGFMGSPTVRNCTFSDNPAPDGTLRGTMSVFNSILLDQVSPSTATCQLAGTGNIQWPTTRPLCGPGFRHGNPLLGALANNGGPTQTMALNPGSAAIDTAIPTCPLTDQRGVLRPRDGDGNGVATCDVGAFER